MALKLCTLFGTRPEIIRLSRVLARADECFDHVTIHSGQNYDHNLNAIFFEEMGVRTPSYQLNMGEGKGLGEKIGVLLSGVEDILTREKPDAFLILGDTNTALGAYMAKRMHIPIFHMEAGNRCFDGNVPEETNRRIVDHMSDYNLVYTEHARRHLIAEGAHHQRVFVTGSPMYEVLMHHQKEIDKSKALSEAGVKKGQYVLASFHREENIDVQAHIKGIIDGLKAVHDRTGYPVLVSTHPRTAQRIQELQSDIPEHAIRFLPAFGFFAYCQLQKNSYCVISDSGTIAEESAILGFSAVTPRYAIERPESLEAGTVVKTAPVADDIVGAVDLAVKLYAQRNPQSYAADYKIPDTAARTVNIIQSMTGSHRQINGLHTKF